jgi:NADPH2:quinone reductase
MKAVRFERHGGPEVLELAEVARPEPRAGEALVRLEAIGLNYIDTYHRSGQYNVPLPYTPGGEGAGIVEAVGDGVPDLQVGDRVAYANVPGSYAEYVAAPAEKLVKIPHGLGTKTAAALMLQGMTAHYLAFSTYPLQEGDTCLVHAAAGGVGLLLAQMAKRCGARVFGTVSTAEKAELAKDAGVDEVIRYTEQDFEQETRRLTDGQGVQVVYDSVGRTTFAKSLNCLAPRGYLVLFGQSSGAVEPTDPQVLNQKGSLFLTRPSLGHYLLTREELEWRASEIMAWAAAGELSVRIDSEIPLEDAAEAHRRLESRETAGKVLLIP